MPVVANRAHSEGIADHVEFAGFQPNPYPLLASSDVFVHAARWEGFGVATLEAAALGLAIVATDSPGGTREIIPDGLLVPVDDPHLLAEALTTVTDPVVRRTLAEQSRLRAEEFAPARVATRLLEIATISCR